MEQNKADFEEQLPQQIENNGANAGVIAISSAADRVLSSLDSINSISSDMTDIMHTFANMRIGLKQIDAELDAFKTATGAKLDKFKLQVPILDKQMDRISDRIDQITDKILALTDDDMSEQALKKHLNSATLLIVSGHCGQNRPECDFSCSNWLFAIS